MKYINIVIFLLEYFYCDVKNFITSIILIVKVFFNFNLFFFKFKIIETQVSICVHVYRIHSLKCYTFDVII